MTYNFLLLIFTLFEERIHEEFEKSILHSSRGNPYKLTPFIVTFCEGELNSIDIRNFIELGLNIVRFKMTRITKADKIGILSMLKDALNWYCKKCQIASWPIAISIDIPNACIRTGFLKKEIEETEIMIKTNWIVQLTADPKMWNKCDSKNIYIDDPYTIKDIPCGTEITILSGKIVMIVIKVINERTLQCKVVNGGMMGTMDSVCVRGVTHTKPPLGKIDLDLIQFAKDNELDIITINSIRKPDTLQRIRKMFDRHHAPLLISSICEQEGLDNIEEIIQYSDGIILAREYLSCEIVDPKKMITIQMFVSAKCKQYGKPFYISGDIFERTLHSNFIIGTEVNDVTNAVLHGAGIALGGYKNPENLTRVLRYIDEVCKFVEPLSVGLNDYWRLSEECPIPTKAINACLLSCALVAKVYNAKVIIVPTASGKTASALAQMTPDSIILAVSTNPKVSRQLQIYRGIIPIVYDKPPSKEGWCKEMDDRVHYAILYAIKYDMLKHGDHYVSLKKSLASSAYADNISCWTITEFHDPNSGTGSVSS